MATLTGTVTVLQGAHLKWRHSRACNMRNKYDELEALGSSGATISWV